MPSSRISRELRMIGVESAFADEHGVAAASGELPGQIGCQCRFPGSVDSFEADKQNIIPDRGQPAFSDQSDLPLLLLLSQVLVAELRIIDNEPDIWSGFFAAVSGLAVPSEVAVHQGGRPGD
jgi:hypothetical protein